MTPPTFRDLLNNALLAIVVIASVGILVMGIRGCSEAEIGAELQAQQAAARHHCNYAPSEGISASAPNAIDCISSTSVQGESLNYGHSVHVGH